MIWALLALYFFGGGGLGAGTVLTSSDVEQLNQQVEVMIEDDTRRQLAMQTLKQLGKDLNQFEKAFAKSGRKLDKLYKNHADNREDALALLDDLDREWQKGQERALDARFELRNKLTEEEWSQLFGRLDQ